MAAYGKVPQRRKQNDEIPGRKRKK